MSNFSNLSRQIVPYNITGLQDINVNTINGSGLFSGVVANTNYPLIYNSTTGILSQTPITQNVDYNGNPRFTSINCNSIFNDTGGDLNINNAYGIITIGTTLNVGGNVSIYNVITNNKVVLAAENTIDYSLRFPLIRNTVADAPLIVSTPTISGYQTLDYNDQAVKTTSNVNFNSVNIPTGQTYKINNVSLNIPNQAVNTTSDVQFNSVKCGFLSAVSTLLTTVKIGGAGLTPGHPLSGYNYVRVQTTATTSGGGGFAFMTGIDGYRGNIGADGGWIYVTADANSSQGIYFSASGICRMASANSYIDFYVGLSSRGTVTTTLMNMLIPITSSAKITGLSLQAATHIFTGAGVGVASIVMPNTATSYTLTLPSGLPSVAGSPLISSLTGTLSYNNQAVSTTSDVTFNSVNASITNPYLVYASWLLGATGSLLTNTNVLSSITTAGYRYISYAPNLPTNSNWVNQGGVFASPTYGFTSGTPRLRVPFNGMYQISTTIDIPVYTFVFPSSYTYYQSLMNAFISKNAQNNNDLDGYGCLVSGTLNNSSSPYTARSINLSCQVYLTTSDYICIGLYNEIVIPATDLGPRCTLHISLIQRI